MAKLLEGIRVLVLTNVLAGPCCCTLVAVFLLTTLAATIGSPGKARLERHGGEVLGVTDHEIVESIYFFDPNGLRVELTTWTASAELMAEEELAAHATLAARTKRQ